MEYILVDFLFFFHAMLLIFLGLYIYGFYFIFGFAMVGHYVDV